MEKTINKKTWKVMYRNTLCYALAAAVQEVVPHERLIIGHSLGDGYYFYYPNERHYEKSELDKIRKTLERLISQDTKVEEITMPYKDALKEFKKRNMPDTVKLIETNAWENIKLYKIGNYLTVKNVKLLPSLGELKCWELRKYSKSGMLLRYPREENLNSLMEWKDNPILFSVFDDYNRNGRILDLYGVGHLNEIISSGNIDDFIEISEALQRRKIIEVSDMIHKRKTIKCIFVAGPSSSNKTTFSKKLCIDLKALGYEPIQISLDDYYFTKDKVPRDENGELDLECPQAIDTNLFRKHLTELTEGKEVYLPHFEFNWGGVGRRTFSTEPIKLQEDTILVIEGLHALNHDLSRGIDKSITFRIYISALTVLNIDEHTRVRTTDNRLIRRMVRDAKHRSAPAEETLSMWESVERGEKNYVFPYQNDVDVMINSAHDYELSVLRVDAIPLLKSIKPTDKKNYPTAQRLLKILNLFYPLDRRYVPSGSMLNEFL